MKKFTTDISIDDYHSGEGISASQLKKAVKSTAHFFVEEPKEKEQKSCFNMGHAFEDMLLEGGELDDKYWIFDPEKRPHPETTFNNKENKTWKIVQFEKNEDKIVITEKELIDLKGMLKSCQSERIQAAIKGDIIKQGSGYWIDKESGLLLKTRPDVIKKRAEHSVFILDVKTAEDSNPEAFAKSFAKFLYGIQCATQVDGIEKTLGVEVAYYYYLVVEKKAPYNAQIYTVNPVDIDTHRAIYKKLCMNIKEAKENPERIEMGYAEDCGNKSGVLELEIPAWYYNNLNK